MLLVLRVSDIVSPLWRSGSNLSSVSLARRVPELNPAFAWHQEIVLLALCSECAHRTLAVASPGTGAAV